MTVLVISAVAMADETPDTSGVLTDVVIAGEILAAVALATEVLTDVTMAARALAVVG